MADDIGRAPSGQALVQAPSPSVSAASGFDPSRGGLFRKRPVEVEAFQWLSQDRNDWPKWAGDDERLEDVIGLLIGVSVVGLKIHTPEGVMRVKHGDWIIRGVKGEIYPCKPDVFALTYDALAAGAQRAETTQLAQSEGRQSGAAEQRNAQGSPQ